MAFYFGGIFAVLVFMSVHAKVSFAKVEITQNQDLTEYRFNVEDLLASESKNNEEQAFVRLSLKGVEGYQGIEFEVGKPEIPVIRILLQGNVDAQMVRELTSKKKLMSNPIWPNQETLSKTASRDKDISRSFFIDEPSYLQLSRGAREPVTIEPAGTVRGVPQWLVTMRPVVYDPSFNQVVLRPNFVVRVRSIQDQVKVLAKPTYVMLIGPTYENSAAFEELKKLKESQGFNVITKVVGQGTSFATHVEIRSFLKSLLKDSSVNLQYALLVGDHDQVPSAKTTRFEGLTDHVYRAIDTDDYESDINGPDIGVGRISVRNADQLGTVVNKLKKYSFRKFSSSQWLDQPAWVTTHDRYTVAEGTHNHVIEKYFAPKGYIGVFPEESTPGGDQLYPISHGASETQIVDHMNAGRFLINFSGHGSHTGWEDVTTQDVLNMDHSDALPYVVSNSCVTGDFRQEPVFAETWLRHPNGAIAFWGSMTYSYWDEDDILEKTHYKGIFEEGLRALDLTHQYGLKGVWSYYGGANRSKYYWETYVTFGDPSMDLIFNR